MATLTPVNISRSGVLQTLTAASAGGDTVTNDGQVFVSLYNSGVAARTVTFDITQTVDDQAVTDRTVSLAAGERKLVGPFPPSVYGVALGITYSDEADISLNPFRLTPGLP